jgi:hypothetical protein
LLIVAIVAWAKLLHRPRLQRLDERSAPRDDGVETACQLLVVALCVSGAAALSGGIWDFHELSSIRFSGNLSW